MKLIHKIWDQHFSGETNFKQFLAIVPQITSVCCAEGQRLHELDSCVHDQCVLIGRRNGDGAIARHGEESGSVQDH